MAPAFNSNGDRGAVRTWPYRALEGGATPAPGPAHLAQFGRHRHDPRDAVLDQPGRPGERSAPIFARLRKIVITSIRQLRSAGGEWPSTSLRAGGFLILIPLGEKFFESHVIGRSGCRPRVRGVQKISEADFLGWFRGDLLIERLGCGDRGRLPKPTPSEDRAGLVRPPRVSAARADLGALDNPPPGTRVGPRSTSEAVPPRLPYPSPLRTGTLTG